jgi:hypothetical protein
MPISNYNRGFPDGVTIRNAPILDLQNSNGNVFWVDSNRGSDDNKGTFTFPLNTLNKALDLVKPDQGDKIFLAAGHEETIQNDTDYIVSTAGIQIIGMGTGTNRPTITFALSSSAALNITANNVYIGNIYFSTTVGSLDSMIIVDGSNFIIENCLLLGGFVTADVFIDIQESRSKILNCKIESSIATQSAIQYSEDSRYHEIIDCDVYGEFSNGCVYVPSSVTGSGVQDLYIDGGIFQNKSVTTYPFVFKGTNTSGFINRNVEIRSGLPERLDIFNDNGSKVGKGAKGDVISFSAIVPVAKIEDSSAYLFNVRSGSFLVENVIWETDSSSLGGATNVNVDNNDSSYGEYIFFEEAVTNLPSRTSVELKDASIEGKRVVLEEGSNLRVNKTGAVLTGGNNLITFSLRLLEDGSNIVKNPSF